MATSVIDYIKYTEMRSLGDENQAKLGYVFHASS